MFFRTVTDMQNRLIRIAGGLLIALSLLGCSIFENQPPLKERKISIRLQICLGELNPYTFRSDDPIVITDPPHAPAAGSDLIGLNSKTGDLDLTGLIVAKHSHDDPSRHVKITYSLDKSCPGSEQYSFYFMHEPAPLEGKIVDPVTQQTDPLGQLKLGHFDDHAPSVPVDYKNRIETGYEDFNFKINYTFVKTDSGGVGTPQVGTVDPNIKNTPVQ